MTNEERINKILALTWGEPENGIAKFDLAHLRRNLVHHFDEATVPIAQIKALYAQTDQDDDEVDCPLSGADFIDEIGALLDGLEV